MIEGCGAIVAPGDVDGLRDTLERLIADPGLRASLGAAGRARAEERYDARKNTPALVELLRGVASAPTTRSTIRRAA
jgi:glycosyltransferase involved in cell wall biosynthesis